MTVCLNRGQGLRGNGDITKQSGSKTIPHSNHFLLKKNCHHYSRDKHRREKDEIVHHNSIPGGHFEAVFESGTVHCFLGRDSPMNRSASRGWQENEPEIPVEAFLDLLVGFGCDRALMIIALLGDR